MDNKNTFARAVRIATVPPVMATAFILILTFASDGVVKSRTEAGTAILCLGVLPVLAYPFQKLFPAWLGRGREIQRKLAFLFSVIGYTLALLFGIITKAGRTMMLVFWTYFISVVLLTLCNAVFKVRASGHMCSVTAPMFLLIYCLDWRTAIPCAMLFSCIAWSSVALKRHTAREVMVGSSVGILGVVISIILVGAARGFPS